MALRLGRARFSPAASATGPVRANPGGSVTPGVRVRFTWAPVRSGPAVARTPPAQPTATYATGSLPGTASTRPSFTRRRRWASASETAMVREP